MISLPLGSILMIAVLFFTMKDVSLVTYLNHHALVLVPIGTIAVLALATPGKEIKALWRSIVDLGKPEKSNDELNTALLSLAKRKDTRVENNHPMIAYAQDLWEQGLDFDIFTALLNQKREEMDSATEQGVAAMRNLAKYPPSLGMMGTVIGLVSLFSGLTDENRGLLGQSLALAMTATFYGLVLANVVLMPLADRLHVLHLRRQKLNDHVFQTLVLIQRGEPLAVIKDEINASAA